MPPPTAAWLAQISTFIKSVNHFSSVGWPAVEQLNKMKMKPEKNGNCFHVRFIDRHILSQSPPWHCWVEKQHISYGSIRARDIFRFVGEIHNQTIPAAPLQVRRTHGERCHSIQNVLIQWLDDDRQCGKFPWTSKMVGHRIRSWHAAVGLHPLFVLLLLSEP